MKKGRLQMQGYRKRWAKIDSLGTLIYSKIPNGRMHGSLDLKKSYLRISHDRRRIDIDTGKATFHFKATISVEFNRWVSVFQKFGNHADDDILGNDSVSLLENSSQEQLGLLDNKFSSILEKIDKLKRSLTATRNKTDKVSEHGRL
jgi:hypothetical protein